MRITLFSFVITLLWSGILAIFIHFCRKKPRFVRKIGTKKLLFLCFFSMVRMMLPYEFSFARALPFIGTFPSMGAFPSIGTFLSMGEFRLIENSALCGIGQGVPIHKEEAGQPLTLSILVLVWIGVSAALLLRFFCCYLKSMRKCSRYSLCEEGLYQKVFWRILNESGSHMKIAVRRSEDVSVPMGVGIFKKSILLPEEAYSPSELYYILLHEFMHFRNRDLLIKAIAQIFSCIYWWNPAVYLWKKDLAQLLEIQCDLDVTDRMQGCDKAGYLAVIVSVLKSASAKRRGKAFYETTALVAGGYGAETVERFQIVSMDSAGRNKNRLVTASWFLSMALLFCVSYSFAASSGHEAPRANHITEAGSGVYGAAEESPLIMETKFALRCAGDDSNMEEDSFVDIMKKAESPYMYLYGSHLR